MFYLFIHAICFKYLITKFNWKMKFSLFLLIPLVYTLKKPPQYAPQTVNLNKMEVVVGWSSLGVHSSSLTSHHGSEETKPKGKPETLVQLHWEDAEYEPYSHLPFQKTISPDS